MPRSSYVIAGVAILAVGGWLASGMLAEEDREVAPQAQRQTEPQPPLVELAPSTAQVITRHIIAQGDVQAFRRVAARTQTEGRVDEIAVSQGERVAEGQPLLSLTLEGRGSRLREARAVLEQRQQDYDAAASLLENGFTTAARVRELRTLLESAREEVQRLEEEVAETTIAAPFAAVVDAVAVEPGEYVTANAEVAMLVDNSPLRVNLQVNQQDVSQVQVGRNARVSFATGQEEIGRVCFVSAAADPETRTFRVEIRTPNEDNEIPSGISAEARIPVGEASAHFVSPAILSLGTDGSLGVKTVDETGTVAFHPIEVIRAQTDGVWVSGLPGETRIITIGQGFVQAGDAVRTAEAEQSDFAGAAAPDRQAPVSGALPEDICEREPSGPQVTAGTLPADPEATGSVEPAEVPEVEPTQAAVDPTGPAMVERAQQALNELGFDAGAADGLLGEQTRQAIREFQEAQDIPATGDLDPATFERITETASSGAAAGEAP